MLSFYSFCLISGFLIDSSLKSDFVLCLEDSNQTKQKICFLRAATYQNALRTYEKNGIKIFFQYYFLQCSRIEKYSSYGVEFFPHFGSFGLCGNNFCDLHMMSSRCPILFTCTSGESASSTCLCES